MNDQTDTKRPQKRKRGKNQVVGLGPREQIEQALTKSLGTSYFWLWSAMQSQFVEFWRWNLETDEVWLDKDAIDGLLGTGDRGSREAQRWSDIIHPDDLEQALGNWTDLVEGRGTVALCEYRKKRDDDVWHTVFSIAGVEEASRLGDPTWLYGVHHDLTFQKTCADLSDKRAQTADRERLAHQLSEHACPLKEIIAAAGSPEAFALRIMAPLVRITANDELLTDYFFIQHGPSGEYWLFSPSMAGMLGIDIKENTRVKAEAFDEKLLWPTEEKIRRYLENGQPAVRMCERKINGKPVEFMEMLLPDRTAHGGELKWIKGFCYLAHEFKRVWTLVRALAGGGVRSSAMQQCRDLAKQAAAVDLTVLLLGESGVGKDVLAEYIHKQSSRKDRLFLQINCAAISTHLFERELFGHEANAFPGAHQKKGLLELADRGTVFLDEIGDLDLRHQVKLLTFLDKKIFMRVGGVKLISTNVRIIAATNKNLQNEVKEGRFRSDLFHRLNVIAISVPPLRERIEELPEIAQALMEGLERELHLPTVPLLTPSVLRDLASYDWPGNVRELKNVLERAVALSTAGRLDLSALPARESQRKSDAIGGGLDEAETPASERVWGWSTLFPEGTSYWETVDELKRALIQKALERSSGNKTKAANLLGMSRDAFNKQMKTLQISAAKGHA